MAFKDFIKPSIWKIIIVLILFVVIAPFINHDNGVRCITVPCDSDTTSSIAFYLFSEYKTVYYIDYLDLLSGLVVCYLVACLIVMPFKRNN